MCIRDAECHFDVQVCILNEYADSYPIREYMDLHMMVRCAKAWPAWLSLTAHMASVCEAHAML